MGCVLLVDDQEDARRTLGEILAGEGFAVRTAMDGEEALAHLRSPSPPDLVLLDLVMPGMDGWEFLRYKRADPGLAGIPVAVVSGADRTEQREAIDDAVGFFVKPINLRALIQLVDRYCPREGAE